MTGETCSAQLLVQIYANEVLVAEATNERLWLQVLKDILRAEDAADD